MASWCSRDDRCLVVQYAGVEGRDTLREQVASRPARTKKQTLGPSRWLPVCRPVLTVASTQLFLSSSAFLWSCVGGGRIWNRMPGRPCDTRFQEYWPGIYDPRRVFSVTTVCLLSRDGQEKITERCVIAVWQFLDYRPLGRNCRWTLLTRQHGRCPDDTARPNAARY